MVMLHGWGLSKADFEASGPAGNGTNTWHWNNVWFAAHGYAVLNYTARGFHRSCGQDPATGYSYASDPACQGKASWTHLADRRWEIHDTQYLAGLLVDAGIAAPSAVVVTGDSYGGGQSWLLALSQDQVMQPDGQLVPWQSPDGVPIQLAAWQLATGHQLKLELTPDDSPTWRPDNLPATMTLTRLALTSPTRS